MVMNITADNGINSVNYTTPTNTKKVDNKNSDAEKSEEIKQDLGKDTFVKSTEDNTANLTYKPAKKKLTTEEVKALNEEQETVNADFIKKFISDTINNQNKLLGKSTGNEETEENVLSQESKDLLSKIFGSLEKAYPEIDTTPEGAQAAISEGGAYSVTAVSDRIMTMATALAGDDQDKLQQMRESVEKGFSEAGLDFKNATNSDLPQISKDTMAEVMSRFDKLQNKTTTTE